MSETFLQPNRKLRNVVVGTAVVGLITGGALTKHELDSSEPEKVTANELAQIQILRNPETRASMQADRTFVPIAGGDAFEITIKDEKGNPEKRLVHITMPNETASDLANRYGVPGEASYFQDQGSGKIGEGGHELMAADPVLLPHDAIVNQKAN